MGPHVPDSPDSTSPRATPPFVVDRREAARLLGVSPGTVDNLRLRGELPSLEIGARRLYAVADLAAFIESRREAPAPPRQEDGLRRDP